MSDLISRAEAKEALRERLKRIPTYAIWAMHIIDELPTHPTPSNTLGALDCVSRQAAIEAIKELCEHYTPTKSVDHPHMNFVIEELQKLPSAQPEIIRCRDCEHHSGSYCHYKYSYGAYVRDNHYCGWAERRTDDI